VGDVGSYERAIYPFLETRHAAMLTTLALGQTIDGPLESRLDAALDEFDTVRMRTGLVMAA